MDTTHLKNVTITIEGTPNPASQKFVVNQKISDQSFEFKREGLNGTSPLAKKLFGFPWVDAVFIGQNFVTITKQDWVDWETLSDALASLISEHIETNQGVIVTPKATNEAGLGVRQELTGAEKSHAHNADDSADVQLIKKLLDSEIRPAVAMDGGDVMFHKYEDQVVYLHLRGACNSCPSSTYTLKTGIASKLREYLPELRDVEAV
jgi:Fe-S cluster biogenesis protein NfuA